jgi:predicted alpha/beta hydrolase family esterase
MEPTLLIIPGLGGSGEQHWQSYWLAAFPRTRKLEQDNWEEPRLDQWLQRLREALQAIDSPTLLVAHSLGVSLVLHWAVSAHPDDRVKGALLVAPADVDSPEHTPEVTRNFAPMPVEKLPFPSIVVGSENDPYVSLPRAAYFAQAWGSQLVNVGRKGHINDQSNVGPWKEGMLILERLLQKSIA